jgi:hypothetical protein
MRLNTRAPWLPPKTSKCGAASAGWEIYCGLLHPAADDTIGHAGNGIRFKRDPWRSDQNGGEHRGAGCIPADTENGVRTKFMQQVNAGEDPKRQAGGGL